MPQSDFGTIDRNESGSDLATQLEGFRDAVQSGNKGATAPTYAQAGTPWLDDSTTPWVLKRFDGVDWITEFSIDPTANAIIIATASLVVASLAEAQAGVATDKVMTPQRVADAISALAVPSTRQVTAGNGLTGGGDLSADRTLTLNTPGTLTGATANSAGPNHTHNVNLTAADVLPSSASAVGAIILGKSVSTSTNVNANSTFAGSYLAGYLNFDTLATQAAAFSGTWRALTQWNNGGGAHVNSGLALRIA